MDFIKKHLFWLLIVTVLIVEFILYIFLVILPGAEVERKLQRKKQIDSSFEEMREQAADTPNEKWLGAVSHRKEKVEDLIREMRKRYALREKDFESFWGARKPPEPAEFRNQYYNKAKDLAAKLMAAELGMPASLKKLESLDEFTLSAVSGLGFRDWGSKIPEKKDIPSAMKEYYIIETMVDIVLDTSFHKKLSVNGEADASAFILQPQSLDSIVFEGVKVPEASVSRGGAGLDQNVSEETADFLEGAEAGTPQEGDEGAAGAEYLIREFVVTLSIPYPLLESLLNRIETHPDMFFVITDAQVSRKDIKIAKYYTDFPPVSVLLTVQQYDFQWTPWKETSENNVGTKNE